MKCSDTRYFCIGAYQNGDTVLLAAAGGGRIPIVELLLNRGAQVDVQNKVLRFCLNKQCLPIH